MKIYFSVLFLSFSSTAVAMDLLQEKDKNSSGITSNMRESDDTEESDSFEVLIENNSNFEIEKNNDSDSFESASDSSETIRCVEKAFFCEQYQQYEALEEPLKRGAEIKNNKYCLAKYAYWIFGNLENTKKKFKMISIKRAITCLWQHIEGKKMQLSTLKI